jgi:HPt (histidine-containing phosphotransfer) domain-containing protein
MAGFEEECTVAGCSGYVTKPIDIDVLFETISRWLSGEARAIDPALERGAGPIAQSQGTSGEPIVSRLGDDPRVQPIIALFVGRLKTQFEAAMRSADDGDLAAVADFAHWLKGSGGTVGFDAFTEPAMQLERLAKAHDESGARAALQTLSLLAERVQVPDVVKAVKVTSSTPQKATVESSGSSGLATPALDEEATNAMPICSRLTSDPRLGRVVAGFVARLANRLTELRDACEAGDFQKVAELAHWLKGSAGSMGFDAFTKPAFELESLAKNQDQQAVTRAVQVVQGMATRVEGYEPDPSSALEPGMVSA